MSLSSLWEDKEVIVPTTRDINECDDHRKTFALRILTFSNDKIRPDKQQDIIAESNTAAAKFINKARIDNVNVWTLEMMVSLSKVS